MKYVTFIFALNIPCSLNTFGDWHRDALNWKNVAILESNDSIYKDFGIETNKTIPQNEGLFNVANHLRACLDFLEQNKFSGISGMRKDYICTEEYDELFFEKVILLNNVVHWENIYLFMAKEYKMKWINFCKKRGVIGVQRSRTTS